MASPDIGCGVLFYFWLVSLCAGVAAAPRTSGSSGIKQGKKTDNNPASNVSANVSTV
jgi:hypothetical protein